MPTLTSSSVTYEFSLEELTKLIAADLMVPIDAIKIDFVQKDFAGYGDRGSDFRTVGLKVTVDNTKIKSESAFAERGGWNDR